MKLKKSARLMAVKAALTHVETVLLGIRGLKHADLPCAWTWATEGKRLLLAVDPTPLRLGEQLALLKLKEAVTDAMKGSCRRWNDHLVASALEVFRSRLSGADETSIRQLALEQMPRSARQAYECYRVAADSVGDGIRDGDAWAWLTRNCPAGNRLPEFNTWVRYLRRARHMLGEQKNRPRGARAWAS